VTAYPAALAEYQPIERDIVRSREVDNVGIALDGRLRHNAEHDAADHARRQLISRPTATRPSKRAAAAPAGP